MGGERASSTRMRERGQVCSLCGVLLSTPFTGRERRCVECGGHRVFVQYFARRGWVVNFLEEDLARPAGRIRTFQDFEALRGMFERCAESKVLENRQALDMGEREGRGSFWVRLTPEQYANLRRR